jgi:hypothetical protein
MKHGVLLLLLFAAFQIKAQLDIAPDTLLFTQRTGGSIDTFDIADNILPSTFDGGRSMSDARTLSVMGLFQDYTWARLYSKAQIDPLRYSSLPHLGFSYSFGSQGTQFLHLRYTQAFRFGFLLNFDYDRTVGNGFLRNSAFSRDNVRLRLQRLGSRYSMHLAASYQSFDTEHTAGVSIDSTDNVPQLLPIGLSFVPVRRNGNSETKWANINLQNYLNFTNDSVSQFGVVTKHIFEIQHRKYFESNSFQALEGYNLFNYDTLQTQDTWNHPSLSNGVGVYVMNHKTGLYLDGAIVHRYWNSWDVRDLRDTNEVDLRSELRYEGKRMHANNSFRINLIGGFNGWENSSQVCYNRNRFQIRASVRFSSMPASAQQRFYFGNNFDYQLSAINRQVWLNAIGSASYNVIDSALSLNAEIQHLAINSAYVFDGTQWSLTDTLGSASSVAVGGHVNWGVLNWLPRFVFSIDRHGYLPDVQVYSRLYIKGRLFAAKKLEALIGVDASVQNGYRLRTYIPSIDAFQWTNNIGVNPGMANIHFFASLGIDQFRFYVRFENVGYFWNTPDIYEAAGYPIAGTRIRLGISWDFFN